MFISYDIQNILDWTRKFVIKRDEYCMECSEKPVSIQQPEFIEREFSLNFRFSNSCLYDEYPKWNTDKQIILKSPMRIWEEIYAIIFSKIRSNH